MFNSEIEYKNIEYMFVAGVIFLLWIFDYWKFFQVGQIKLPKNSFIKSDVKFNALRMLFFTIGIFAWINLIIAVGAPRKPQSFSQGEIEVNDIFFVLDVSRSMLADDLPPNRLEVAKEKLREFVKLRPKDRIGVILFSEKVFTLLPLTTDATVVDKIISEIDVGFLGSGTNIGDGLALAVARAAQTDTKNKVIILLTDGVSNVGNLTPLQAGEVAKEFNIKVYTIGIGTDENARLPIGDSRFGQRYMSIPGGSIDMDVLKKIADMTNAKSYYANSEGSLMEILSDIEKLERTEIKSDNKIIYKELYFNYLLTGFILFILVDIFRRFLIKEVEV